jgi:capsular exopolysaccharide synthesis family protein
MNDLNLRPPVGVPAAVELRPTGEPAAGSRAIAIFPLLSHYLGVVRRRKWLILAVVVVALAASLVLTIMATPMYTASSTIEIQREEMNITRVRGVEPEAGPADMEFYQTQYGLLRSRTLAERVATEQRLVDTPTLFALYHTKDADRWFENGQLRAGASTREQRLSAAATILLTNIAISPVRLSRLVDVSFTSPDPAFSVRIADAWTNSFIQITLDRRYQATSYARNFLEQRLQQLRGRLDESERALVGYAARERIINLPGVPSSPGEAAGVPERPLITDELTAFARELAAAEADRIRAESRLQSSGGTVPEALDNVAINGLRQRRAELAAEYSRLTQQFEPEYPAAVAARQQIAELDRSIAREEARVRNSLQGTYRSSLARQGAVNQRVEALKADLLDLRRRSIQYNIFQRDVDTNRQLYDALLQRYKEIGVAGGVGVNNISIVDPARMPIRPSSPRPLLNLLIALLAGSMAGLGLALALEQIDDAISDPSDLEKIFGLPLLGTIPNSKEDPYLALADRKSMVSEAYIALQTSLSFSTDHGVPKTMAVTSTRPGEGKSTTAYAIAHSLARIGRSVLLIDGDMRAPSVHSSANISNERGLSNFLAGEDDVTSLIHRNADSGVSIMPAGPPPPSAAELLTSERLGDLFQSLQHIFDHVVIDSPPVMGLADAPLLASKAEGTVFVIESHGTKIGQAKLAIARLVGSQAHLLGGLLTKFESKRAAYGYGYGYDYGYGYERKPEEPGN